MTTFIRPRLRKPAVTALAGLLFAAAWLVRGGPLWWVSIMALIATAVRVFSPCTGWARRTPTRAPWPLHGQTSARRWSACARVPWPAISLRSRRSSA